MQKKKSALFADKSSEVDKTSQNDASNIVSKRTEAEITNEIVPEKEWKDPFDPKNIDE